MDKGYPKLRADLIVSRQTQAGQTVYIIKDPLTEKYFRLREPEYALARALDGQTELGTIASKLQAEFGIAISVGQIGKFVEELEAKGFLESPLSEYRASRPDSKQPRRSLFDRILYVKLKAFDPQLFLEVLYRRFAFTLRPPFLAFSALIISAGLSQAYALSSRMPYNVYQAFGLGSIPLILLAIFIIVALHELAHGLVCRHFGGKVHEMGFLLLYFQICFYCNISDSYLFAKKRQRIYTILAGLYFQLFLGSLTLLVWRIIKTGTLLSDFLFLLASLSLVTLLLNLNPLIKLDGYYLLTELLEIPNLRGRAFGYLKRILRTIFLHPDPNPLKPTARERRIYILYSLLAVLFSILLFFWLGQILYQLLVSAWGGTGFLLFLVIIGIIFNEPVRKGLIGLGQIGRRQADHMRKTLRFYIWMAILVILVGLIFVLPVKLKINAPIVIRPLERFIVRSNASGHMESNWFRGGLNQQAINRVYRFSIADFAVLNIEPSMVIGAPVDSGQILLEISSGHFTSQLMQTQAEIEKAQAEYQLLLADPKAAELARAKASLEETKLRQVNAENEYQINLKLHEKNLISDEKWDLIKTQRQVLNKQVDIAQSEFDLLKAGPKAEELLRQDAEIKRLEAKAKYLHEQIDACTVHAPFKGEITRFAVEGEIISMARTDTVEIMAMVPESEVDILAVGQEAQFRVAGYPNLSFKGKIDKVLTTALPGSEDSHFSTISLTDNSARQLKAGMTGYAKIYCGQSTIAKNLFRKILRFFRVEFWSWW